MPFAVRRQIHTGSWLGRRFQGRGIGTHTRAAVLELAFAGLGAHTAVSAAFEDNPASLAVSRTLGSRDHGIDLDVVRGRPVVSRRLLLDRASWQRHRTLPVQIDGLAACRPLLGCPPASSPTTSGSVPGEHLGTHPGGDAGAGG